MPKLKNTLIATIPAKDIPKWSKWTEEHFWKDQRGDAGELYNHVLTCPGRDIRSDSFLGLVYGMLAAFKMNARGAILSEPADFKKTIKKHADTIESLAKVKLEKVKESDSGLINTIGSLFDHLHLTQTKSRLVTFSKTMHFLLPNLFMPIDRWYTLRFFYGHPPANQKACFLEVFEQCRAFAHQHSEALKALENPNSRWNRNVPKIIDNVIIGYVSNKMD